MSEKYQIKIIVGSESDLPAVTNSGMLEILDAVVSKALVG